MSLPNHLGKVLYSLNPVRVSWRISVVVIESLRVPKLLNNWPGTARVNGHVRIGVGYISQILAAQNGRHIAQNRLLPRIHSGSTLRQIAVWSFGDGPSARGQRVRIVLSCRGQVDLSHQNIRVHVLKTNQIDFVNELILKLSLINARDKCQRQPANG